MEQKKQTLDLLLLELTKQKDSINEKNLWIEFKTHFLNFIQNKNDCYNNSSYYNSLIKSIIKLTKENKINSCNFLIFLTELDNKLTFSKFNKMKSIPLFLSALISQAILKNNTDDLFLYYSKFNLNKKNKLLSLLDGKSLFENIFLEYYSYHYENKILKDFLINTYITDKELILKKRTCYSSNGQKSNIISDIFKIADSSMFPNYSFFNKEDLNVEDNLQLVSQKYEAKILQKVEILNEMEKNFPEYYSKMMNSINHFGFISSLYTLSSYRYYEKFNQREKFFKLKEPLLIKLNLNQKKKYNKYLIRFFNVYLNSRIVNFFDGLDFFYDKFKSLNLIKNYFNVLDDFVINRHNYNKIEDIKKYIEKKKLETIIGTSFQTKKITKI